MGKNKLSAILPAIFLLTLTSCGGETFTEVTDSTQKESALTAAKKENSDQSSFTSAQMEIGYSGTINSNTIGGSAVFAAGFSDDSQYVSNYTSIMADSNNYYKSAIVYSSADSTFYNIIDAKAKTGASNFDVKGKFSLGNVSESDYEADTEAAKNNLIKKYFAKHSYIDIPSITSDTDGLKIYKGSKGSTKIEFTDDDKNYSFIIDSSGYLINAALSIINDKMNTTGTMSYTYNMKSVMSLNPSDYTTIAGDDLILFLKSVSSVTLLVTLSMGISVV